MSPVRLAMPASPHLAAARAGVELSLAPAIAAFKKLQFRHETVLVEGAGGVLVPVCGNQTMLDLMVALALPVILVARPGLGTINHSLLSINELRRAKLRLAGVLFCATTAKPWGEIEEDNMQTVARLGKVPVLGHIPWIPGLGETVPPPPAFLQHFRLPTCP